MTVQTSLDSKCCFVFNTTIFSHPQGCLWSDKASKDEHGEENHGAAEAGGVQSPGQCSRTDASATPLLRTLSPSTPHDPERAGGEALYDASCIQQGTSHLWRK